MLLKVQPDRLYRTTRVSPPACPSSVRGTAVLVLRSLLLTSRYAKRRAYERAVQLIRSIRVVKQQPPELMALLLARLFTPQVSMLP